MAELPSFRWCCRERTLVLRGRTAIMGILNVTPDSFSDGGRYSSVDAAVARGLALADEGADIIDVGGESSRPGAEPVSAAEEIDRIVPVIRRLAGGSKSLLSVDTAKAEVAAAALDAGAHIINDITAMTGDPDMAGVAVSRRAGLVLMHMQGEPRTMQEHPTYGDVVSEVGDYLRGRVEDLVRRGADLEQLVVDPGIGFGKTVAHNVSLLARLGWISQRAGRPLLVGMSRKSFLGKLTGLEVGERLAPSLAALAFAVMNGAAVVRVHDVKESCAVARLMDTLRQEQAKFQ